MSMKLRFPEKCHKDDLLMASTIVWNCIEELKTLTLIDWGRSAARRIRCRRASRPLSRDVGKACTMRLGNVAASSQRTGPCFRGHGGDWWDIGGQCSRGSFATGGPGMRDSCTRANMSSP